MRGKVIIVQGGQWGSEGKGQVASELAWRLGAYHAVRTGSINAGHTVYWEGKRFVMQIIPTSWVIPSCQLYLGAGCYIEPSILENEVAFIKAATGEDIRNRLMIDHRCVWFGDAEHARAKAANRHHAMGATGKGASEGIISKMLDRGSGEPAARLFINREAKQPYQSGNYRFGDTVLALHCALNRGEHVLLEGTQGSLLDFNTGPYPYVTSRMTNAAAWLAEAGLPPVNVSTALVLRTYPIRVAGNSGPMTAEISWPVLARRVNEKLARYGMNPAVDPAAIDEFERALAEVIHSLFPEVEADPTITKEDRIHFHRWTAEQRVRHRVAVSEANAAALRHLLPAEVEKLRFFEKTTVTKKLRRVAEFSVSDACEAVRMNAPDFIVLTFLNYQFPHLEGARDVNQLLQDSTVHDYLVEMQERIGVRIRFVTTGPLPDHQLELPVLHGQS